MKGRREAGIIPARANQQRELVWSKINWTKIKARVEKMQRGVFQEKPEPDAVKVARPVPTSSGCGYPLTLEGEGPRSGPRSPDEPPGLLIGASWAIIQDCSGLK